MCKLNKKSGNKRIDPCMKNLINNFNYVLKNEFEILSCCCGHEKYPMTIVIKEYTFKTSRIFEFFSGLEIPRKKRFYKKDKEGYYYIPKVVNKK